MSFHSKKNGENKSFSCKTNASNHASQWEECVYSAQSLKELRLLRESEFVQFKGWTLIVRKMLEIKVHHNLALKYAECVYSVQSLKEWRLLRESKFVLLKERTFDFKESGGKKSVSCKTKASKLCIWPKRTCL